MGIKERKEREKLQKRASILEAAEKLFLQKGIDNVTMDELAASLEISKGALYLHFQNKEDLYLEIIQKGIKLLRKTIEKEIEKASDGLSKALAICKAYIDFSKKHKNYFNSILYFEAKEVNEKKSSQVLLQTYEESDKTLKILIQAIEQGIKDGSVYDKLDPVETAILIWSHLTGTLQLILAKGKALKKFYSIETHNLLEKSLNFIERSLSKK